MVQGLITIARALVALEGPPAGERYARSRHPASETIDGMLYYGLRPATHNAA